MRDQRRVTAEELATLIQKDRAAAKQTLEGLIEAGLVEAHGNTKGRSYTLAAKVYGAMGSMQSTRGRAASIASNRNRW